jgi:hypothetical protein
VITDEHVFWMDNGRNHVTGPCSARASARSGAAVVGARTTTARRASVEISGLPHGTESNPPGWDPQGRIVVAYDAGNAVVRAWRVRGDELEPLWRRDGLAHAGHLIVYPDTRELVAQDWQDTETLLRPAVRRTLRPAFQLLARSAAARRPRCAWAATTSSSGPRHGSREGPRRGPVALAGVPLPRAGFGRDVYYQSLTTIARVAVR